MPEYRKAGMPREIPSNLLLTGQGYQRTVQEKDLAKLLREWDNRVLEPLLVSFRDGKYYVIDGQHRLAAIRRMNDDKDAIIPCTVLTGLTYEDEADLFYRIDAAKRRLSAAQATKALVEAETDPEINEVLRLIKDAGFVWVLENRRGGTNEISSTRAVIKAYRDLGAEAFARMLALLKSTWDGDPNSLLAAMIAGMALFLKTYTTEISDKFFVQRLGSVDPLEIGRKAKTDFSTNSNALRYAKAIWNRYNTAKRGSRKLPYRLEG